MKLKKIVCKVCGEETISSKTNSFYGSVHKWGPTTHAFIPVEVPDESEQEIDTRQKVRHFGKS